MTEKFLQHGPISAHLYKKLKRQTFAAILQARLWRTNIPFKLFLASVQYFLWNLQDSHKLIRRQWHGLISLGLFIFPLTTRHYSLILELLLRCCKISNLSHYQLLTMLLQTNIQIFFLKGHCILNFYFPLDLLTLRKTALSSSLAKQFKFVQFPFLLPSGYPWGL